MKKVILGLGLVLLANVSFAIDYVLFDATVTEIVATGSSDEFAVVHSGGTGTCASTALVFKASEAPSADAFNRLYATALTAITTGMKIRVGNYVGSSCSSVDYIKLYK